MRIIALNILILFVFRLPGQNSLHIPPTLQGPQFQLNLQNGQHEFFPGHMTATMGANGNILGPTLIMNTGDSVDIRVTNHLAQPTTLHWHGMHVSAANDGGPHTVIAPGTTWNPRFLVMNRASTMWYHPHLDEFTDEHVSKGIAGMIIIHDSVELNAGLPHTYGVDDFPIIVQTKDFDNNYQIVHHSNQDDVLMVNATIDPYLDVPAQIVRLRLLNGSSQRVFNFGLTNNRPFYLIATDGGLLEAPQQLTRVMLSPGERAEILLDLNNMQGQTLYLMSYASELGNGIYGAAAPGMNPNMTLDNYYPNPMNGNDFNILQLNVTAPTSQPVTGIPASFEPIIPLQETDADEFRNFTLSPVTMGFNQLNGDFTINGVSFDMNVINVTVPLNNLEVWTITNQSAIAHPFHIHDITFQILSINGSAQIPPNARGWHDTYLVPPGGGSIKIITRFEDFADDTIPYMYHCHMLNHEDGGMMGAFTVVDTSTKIDKMTSGAALIYPNPVLSNTYLTVQLKNKSDLIKAYTVLNQRGQIVYHHNIHENEQNYLYSFPVFELAEGTYIVKIYTGKSVITKSFIIQ